MRKAHLYEAIFLFNRGADDAACGLERLKRWPGLGGEIVEKMRLVFEEQRALVNSHFCNVREGVEDSDAENFEQRVHEQRKGSLDESTIYNDVRLVEERRKEAGEPPMVRFLTPEEQKAWRRPLQR